LLNPITFLCRAIVVLKLKQNLFVDPELDTPIKAGLPKPINVKKRCFTFKEISPFP